MTTKTIPGSTEYPTIQAFNADGSLFYLLRENDKDILDHVGLYKTEDCSFLRDLPITASGEPRWGKGNLLYFHPAPGNVLCSLDVSEPANLIHTVRTFREYAVITIGNGEGDIPEDGDHFALVGTRPGGGTDVFVYCLSKDERAPALVTARAVESVYINNLNQAIISWVDDPLGVRESIDLWDGTKITPLFNRNGHKGVGRAMWIINSNENPVTLPNYPNGIVEVDWDGKQCGLISLPWLESVHISANAVESTRKLLVETYHPHEDDQSEFSNVLFLLDIATGEAEILCKHSEPIAGVYDSEPLATISADGTRVLYRSGPNETTMLTLDAPDVAHAPVPAVPLAPSTSIEERVSILERQVAGLIAK